MELLSLDEEYMYITSIGSEITTPPERDRYFKVRLVNTSDDELSSLEILSRDVS